jgi:hypothetical protein
MTKAMPVQNTPSVTSEATASSEGAASGMWVSPSGSVTSAAIT